jgi:hypothetical protein
MDRWTPINPLSLFSYMHLGMLVPQNIPLARGATIATALVEYKEHTDRRRIDDINELRQQNKVHQDPESTRGISHRLW